MAADRIVEASTVVVAAVAVFAALSVASSVFAPLALAFFIIALVWPIQRTLEGFMPKLVALVLSVLLLLVVFVAFGSLVAWAFGRAGRWMVSDAARFQALYAQVGVWLEGHGIALAGVWSEFFDMGLLVRTLQSLSGRVNSTMSFWIVALVYVILGLLEVELLTAKAKSLHNVEVSRVLVRGFTESARKIRRYMLVRTQMSVLTGVLVWAFARFIGLDLAAEWGVLAFALNYIPFLGPLIATLFPTAFALVQFESWQAALGVFACLNAIQFVVGSYVEPRISGSALSISPTLVLFAVFFWTFLWGVFGAFIGVPITIAVLTFCAQHDSSRWLAHLLGSDAPPPPLERAA